MRPHPFAPPASFGVPTKRPNATLNYFPESGLFDATREGISYTATLSLIASLGA